MVKYAFQDIITFFGIVNPPKLETAANPVNTMLFAETPERVLDGRKIPSSESDVNKSTSSA